MHLYDKNDDYMFGLIQSIFFINSSGLHLRVIFNTGSEECELILTQFCSSKMHFKT
jgi:hypothetical protein